MAMKSRKLGFGLIEIVVAVAILGVTIYSLSFVFILASRLSAEASNKVRANFLAEEGIEAMHFLRDKSWTSNLAGMSAGTDYYLSFDAVSSVWSLETTDPGLIDDLYTRRIQVESVSRDSNDDIVESGGTVDPQTKKIKSIVSWTEKSLVRSVEVDTYLSNMFNN